MTQSLWPYRPCLALGQTVYMDCYQVLPLFPLATECLLAQHGVVLPGIVAFTVLEVEVKDSLAEFGIVRNYMLAILYHFRKHIGKLLALTFRIAVKLTQAKHIALAYLTV